MDILKEYNPDVKVDDEQFMVIGQNLITRNGRIGNGIIIGVEDDEESYVGRLYTILTDFGNTIQLTWSEIRGAFDVENSWVCICDVEARIRTQLDLLAKALDALEGSK